jgi:DNA-directed RNA polymerase sigma subunit (sigma70/sigma32)
MTSYHQSVETKVFSNITYDEIMKLLTDTEKDMVLMKMNNATFQQIADKYGVTRQRIGIVFNKIRGKVNRHMGVVTR